MPHEPVDWVDQISEAIWAEGMANFHHVSLCPWIALADRSLFAAEVSKLAGLSIDVILGAHTPAIRGDRVARAFEYMSNLPNTPPPTTQFGD
jgi:hypothetical protein